MISRSSLVRSVGLVNTRRINSKFNRSFVTVCRDIRSSRAEEERSVISPTVETHWVISSSYVSFIVALHLTSFSFVRTEKRKWDSSFAFWSARKTTTTTRNERKREVTIPDESVDERQEARAFFSLSFVTPPLCYIFSRLIHSAHFIFKSSRRTRRWRGCRAPSTRH